LLSFGTVQDFCHRVLHVAKETTFSSGGLKSKRKRNDNKSGGGDGGGWLTSKHFLLLPQGGWCVSIVTFDIGIHGIAWRTWYTWRALLPTRSHSGLGLRVNLQSAEYGENINCD